jgi:hypothetical protein
LNTTYFTCTTYRIRVLSYGFSSYRVDQMPQNTRSKMLLSWIICALALPQLHASPGGSDAEPVDPAEFRVQKMPPVLSELPQSRAANLSGVWVSRGPAPTQSAQVRVPPDNEVCGAIHALAVHPTNADVIYVGAVNGGVWRTLNATVARPSWNPLTDNLPSQSIGAVVFDPLDVSAQTLIAGTGRWSNFAQRGDDEIGVYRSTNGGVSWALLGGTTLLGQKLISVVARGNTLFAASFGGGLFRSTDTGANWTLISGLNGLPTGGIGALSEDRLNPNRLIIAVRGAVPKILRSDDLGATWIDITAGVNNLNSTSAMRIAVGASSVLFTAVINSGALNGVYRSLDLGASWTAMDVPAVHPGTQGTVNTALAADPNNANIVFLSGDRITAGPFTGNVARLDASLPLGTQNTFVVDGGASNTAPHADSRAMAFDANGNLLETDDGGIYRLNNPNTPTRVWSSVIGNLNVMEAHNVARDTLTNVLIIGAQDNGTHQQQTAADDRWVFINGGDGGDVAVDSSSLGPSGSFRYLSSQNLGGFRRAQYSSVNAFVGSFSLPALLAGDPQFVTPFELNATNDNRMLVGGANNLYESSNISSGAPVLTSIGAPGANRQAIAYGASNDPDALYVGKAAAVWKRSGAAGAIVQTTALPAGAAAITDVTMDPSNSARVYAADDNQVFASTDGGTSWADVTGNLPTISGQDFRSIEYISDAAGDGVVLGTRSGVYYAALGSSSWSRVGTGMPDVLVFDIRYLSAQRTLIAGTLGRGVWTYVFVQGQIFANGFE